MEIIKILLVLILAAIVVLCAVLLYLHFAKRLNDLEARVAKMEEANKKRMPYEAMDALIDAMATVNVMEREEAFKLSLIENLKAHITSSMAVGTKREKK